MYSCVANYFIILKLVFLSLDFLVLFFFLFLYAAIVLLLYVLNFIPPKDSDSPAYNDRHSSCCDPDIHQLVGVRVQPDSENELVDLIC